MNFKLDIFDFDSVVFEGFSDNVEKFRTELFDKEGVFDTDNDVAFVGRDKAGVLEPGRKITSRNFLLNLS